MGVSGKALAVSTREMVMVGQEHGGEDRAGYKFKRHVAGEITRFWRARRGMQLGSKVKGIPRMI